MNNTSQLAKDPVHILLFKFSTPAIIAMLANALYNVCDRIFVGRGVGTLGISAITAAYPISLIIIAFSMLVGIGAVSLVSIKLGEQNINEAELVLGNTFTLSVIVSIVLTFLGYIFIDPVLNVFGGKGEVLIYSKEYTNIFLLSTLFQILGFSMNSILRGQGNAKKAMQNMLAGIILNIIFNPIFIFMFNMGIKGSALATVLSITITSICATYSFLSKKSTLKLYVKNLKLKKHILFKILSIGVSAFLMQLAMCLITIVFNKRFEIYGGNISLATYGIINSLFMLIFMPINGIIQGVQPIIGYNYGFKNFKRVKKALNISLISVTIISIIGFLILELFSDNIIRIFSISNSKLITIGSHAIKICASMIPFVGIQILGSNYFQFIGKAKHSIILCTLRQVILLIPLIIILPIFLKLDGIWLSIPISDFISSIITIVLLFKEVKNLSNK
ncbi:MATE family efflux transporter [Clostridium sp. JS66]|uniref:MATE family efflux transporter n=1 Tax=Clostridium sp. JS66 TaxID=3064705 RepID=UPI00298D8AAB|nr:MATE family efflux transporter [Clostridium sp. JS66]WPC44115.1 MATE family efflux transporter [Clostridium sp. JS66]